MVDPLLTGLTVAVQAVVQGAGNEAGKRGVDALGAFARRVLGRDVRAPRTPAERLELTNQLYEAVRSNPQWRADADFFIRLAPELAAAAPGVVPRPRLRTTRHFLDRRDIYRGIQAEWKRRGHGARAVVLHGPQGAGTSTVAAHWAADRQDRFPGGQLYADLRGDAASTALTPAQVLRSFLARLGVADDRTPATQEELTELFHAVARDRQLLVLLDHVHSAAEAEPFLVRDASVLTLIVSRSELPGLEARSVPVGPLPRRYTRQLVGHIAGSSRLATDPTAATNAIAHCAGNPLALTALGHRAVSDGTPDWAALEAELAELAGTARAAADLPAGESQEEGDMTDEPADLVRSSAELAYRRLSPEDARLYRLLALRPWPDITAPLAAAAAEVSVPAAEAALERIAALALLERRDAQRYHFRAAVRSHAEQAAVAADGILRCGAAVRRVIDRYLDFAVEADYFALPKRWRQGPRYDWYFRNVPPDEVSAPRSAQALEDLRREHPNLAEAVRAAEELGEYEFALELCEALWALLLKIGLHEELLPALRLGARVADERYPNSRIASRMHTQSAYALLFLARYDEAEAAQRAAEQAAREAGHKVGTATALEALAVLRLHQWRYEEAEEFLHAAQQVLNSVAAGEEGVDSVPRATAILLYHLGRALRGQGQQAAALDHFTRARQQFNTLADHHNEAKARTGLAGVHLDAGEVTAALPELDRAVSALDLAGGADLVRADIAELRDRCTRESDGEDSSTDRS